MNDPVVLQWWQAALGVLLIIAAAWWVAHKEKTPRTFGFAALVIVFLTGWAWFTSLPTWTPWLPVVVTVALFVTGMLLPEDKDDVWHYGALMVAVLGKLLIAGLAVGAPGAWKFAKGEVSPPPWVVNWIILVLATTLLITLSKRSKWVQGLGRRFLRKRPEVQPKTDLPTG